MLLFEFVQMAKDPQVGCIPRDVRRVATVASTRQDHFFRKKLNDNYIRQLLREDGVLLVPILD